MILTFIFLYIKNKYLPIFNKYFFYLLLTKTYLLLIKLITKGKGTDPKVINQPSTTG